MQLRVSVGSEVFYNKATELNVESVLPGLSKVAGMCCAMDYSNGSTMSLQCYYFTLWANFGALCMGQLLNPSTAEKLKGTLFPENFPVLQHCFTQMLGLWDMLSQYFNITAEHRLTLVNTCFGKVYEVSKTKTLCTDLILIDCFFS